MTRFIALIVAIQEVKWFNNYYNLDNNKTIICSELKTDRHEK